MAVYRQPAALSANPQTLRVTSAVPTLKGHGVTSIKGRGRITDPISSVIKKERRGEREKGRERERERERETETETETEREGGGGAEGGGEEAARPKVNEVLVRQHYATFVVEFSSGGAALFDERRTFRTREQGENLLILKPR